MKKNIILFAALFSGFAAFSQDRHYDALAQVSRTKVVYDRVSGFSRATQFSPKRVTKQNYFQLYHELQRADFSGRWPNIEQLRHQSDLGFAENKIPLSIIISDFENISLQALENRTVYTDASQNLKTNAGAREVFEENHLAIASPILAETKTYNPVFVLKPELIFRQSEKSLASFEIKQNGAWTKVAPNEDFSLRFSADGKQEIPYRITLSDGKSTEGSFEINVRAQTIVQDSGKTNLAPQVVTQFTAGIPYKGYGETAAYNGVGEYEIFLDTVNGVLDKPIIMVDGFDPGDTRNTTAIYGMLNYGSQNLGNTLRAKGYDVVILNFPTYTRSGTTTVVDGGVDYIQRNAMVLLELLKKINAQKVGNAKNVVIGPSMGGLITRYALKYMEKNNMEHDTRLWISFDSPHYGANVPIAFQHLFNYMGNGPLGNTTMQDVVNGMLKSPAAREMLIDQFEGHLQAGSDYEFNTADASLLPVGCPNYRTAFQTELNALGFPTKTRNISVINGAGNGTANGTPGMVVLDHTFNTSSTQRAIVKVNYTPKKNTAMEVSRVKGQQWVLFWLTILESAASSKGTATSDGLDTAPGGRYDLNGLAAMDNPLVTEFLAAMTIKYFCFIPAASAMAVPNPTNWYAIVPGSASTPFAAQSVPMENQNHVQVTATNATFIMNEILAGTLATSENIQKNISVNTIVKNEVRIHSPQSLRNAQISIIDAAGRIIWQKTMDLQEQTAIYPNLQRGNYILKISGENVNFSSKIIKD